MPSARDLLRIKPIDVYYPCDVCDHDHVAGPCPIKESILDWKQVDGKLTAIIGACPCEKHEGLLEDGKARALRMRMPSNGEWSAMQTGVSMPAKLDNDPPAAGPPPKLSPEAVDQHLEWSRKVAMCAVTHIRYIDDGGHEAWGKIKVVPTAEECTTPQHITIADFDVAGTGVISALVKALVAEFNGGEWGGVMRSFRHGRARHVSRAVDGVQTVLPTRDAVQPSERPGGVDSPA